MGETKKRVRPATSIPIDPAKLRLVLRRRFITNREASELLGKSSEWMAVVLNKRRINFYMLDDLAGALNMNFSDLFEEIVDEEQFGPILPIVRFDDIDAVIDRVNASPQGLGGPFGMRTVEPS